MSLNELDIIFKANGRLKSRVETLKQYIFQTKLSNGETIDVDHLVSYKKITKNWIIPIFNMGLNFELFRPVYKYYCGDKLIGETEIKETLTGFCDVCCDNHEFEIEEMKIGYKILFLTGAEPIMELNELENLNNFKFGIITALPHEFEAF